MICDGILPSNEGAGLCAAALAAPGPPAMEALGANDPFLYQVVDTVIHEKPGTVS